MANKNAIEWFYELDDGPEDKPMPLRMQRAAAKRWPRHPDGHYVEQQDGRENFNFTYHASRHERWWLLDSLGNFYHNRWIDDVLRLVKGGKEASVYVCQAASSTASVTRNLSGLIAAKVYRPRTLRNLRNDALYREGRPNLDEEGQEVRDDRMIKAMRQKTRYGQELLHTSWIGYEFTALQDLHQAGVDVPRPYASDHNAILMDYIGDENMAAPPLSDIHLEAEEASPLFERSVVNIERMLAAGRIHGDLSAYNILYWEGAITLIDFPQVVSPEQNQNVFRIFERDVTRVCEYFVRQGVRGRAATPHRLAVDLWTAYRHKVQPQVDPALLDAEDEKDVALWKTRQE